MIHVRYAKRLALGVGMIIVVTLLGAAVHRAAAGGVPATGALAYAGLLRDASGASLTGSHNIEVKLWSTASSDGNQLCTTNSKSVMLSDGRFSIGLPDDCVAQVQKYTDVASELLVDGASLGRAPLSAVPYAIEASHAVSSDRAANADHADTAAEASHAADSDTLKGRAVSTFAGSVHGHQLVNCQSVQGACGVGTFNQPTYFLDRIAFACPRDRPVMSGFKFSRCGELMSPTEGLAVTASCCAIQ